MALDFVDNNLKIIMGFVWTLILRYQLQTGGGMITHAHEEFFSFIFSVFRCQIQRKGAYVGLGASSIQGHSSDS